MIEADIENLLGYLANKALDRVVKGMEERRWNWFFRRQNSNPEWS